MERNLTIPYVLNENLAEFIGMYLGDGHLGPHNYEICIVCGNIDYPYITKFVPDLMQQLFSIKPKLLKTKKNKAIKCRIYSKDIFDFLINKYNFSSGKKIKPKIPAIIFKNKTLLKSCVRGLIDTDGGIHKHHINSIQLKFDNKEYELISSLKEALIILGFNPRLSDNQKRDIFTLYLFGNEVKKYFKEVGSNNMKNIIKFKTWKEKGVVPKNTELILK